jgi:hypothetical protein
MIKQIFRRSSTKDLKPSSRIFVVFTPAGPLVYQKGASITVSAQTVGIGDDAPYLAERIAARDLE